MAASTSISVPAAVAHALPLAHQDHESEADSIAGEISHELWAVAEEAADARSLGVPVVEAVSDHEGYPNLAAFHQSLRDALLIELPKELRSWLESSPGQVKGDAPQTDLHALLFQAAAPGGALGLDLDVEQANQRDRDKQVALAELLLFESVRLQLLITIWSSEEFEGLGGDEQDIDHIAYEEVLQAIAEPEMATPGIRPVAVMIASANLMLSRDSHARARELQMASADTRETLRMRARLRAALRELRLTESVLLENAFSNLLDTDRIELGELQTQRPMALDGLTRQTMDQRVSRGRRALRRDRKYWPDRRGASLFDLMRTSSDD